MVSRHDRVDPRLVNVVWVTHGVHTSTVVGTLHFITCYLYDGTHVLIRVAACPCILHIDHDMSLWAWAVSHAAYLKGSEWGRLGNLGSRDTAPLVIMLLLQHLVVYLFLLVPPARHWHWLELHRLVQLHPHPHLGHCKSRVLGRTGQG